MRSIVRPITLAAFAVAAVPVARAQAVHVEVTPFIGAFIPTAALGLVRVRPLGPTITNKAEMTSSMTLGGRIDVYSRGRVGVQGMYFHSSGGMRTTNGPVPFTPKAVVQGGAVKVNYQATAAQTGTDLVLSLGVSGISHSGAAFALDGNNFDMGGVVGGGLHIVVSPTVTLRFDGDLLLYRFASAALFPRTTQSDLMISAGLGLKLGR